MSGKPWVGPQRCHKSANWTSPASLPLAPPLLLLLLLLLHRPCYLMATHFLLSPLCAPCMRARSLLRRWEFQPQRYDLDMQ